jgi:hypothetical protein
MAPDGPCDTEAGHGVCAEVQYNSGGHEYGGQRRPSEHARPEEAWRGHAMSMAREHRSAFIPRPGGVECEVEWRREVMRATARRPMRIPMRIPYSLSARSYGVDGGHAAGLCEQPDTDAINSNRWRPCMSSAIMACVAVSAINMAPSSDSPEGRREYRAGQMASESGGLSRPEEGLARCHADA